MPRRLLDPGEPADARDQDASDGERNDVRSTADPPSVNATPPPTTSIPSARPGISEIAGRASRAGRAYGGYVAVMTIAFSIGAVKGFVYAGVLGADQLAYYGLVLLALEFGLYISSWGVLHGLHVELPMAYGRGDPGADEAVGRAFGALLVTSAITAVVYLAVVTLAATDPDAQIALSLAAVTVAVTLYGEFCALVLRCRQEPMAMAWTYLLRGVLAIVLGSIAAAIWGFKAAIIAEILAIGIAVAFSLHKWLPDVRPLLPTRSTVLPLARTGLPMVISAVVAAAALSADRLFVANTLPDDFGKYVLAFLIVVGLNGVAGMLTNVVAPQILYARGAGESLTSIRRRVRRIALTIVTVALAGLPVLLLITTWLGNGPLEEYKEGLAVVPILYLGGVMVVLSTYGWVLIAARRLYVFTAANALAAVVSIGAGLLVALTNPTLAGFAWAFVIGQAVSLTLIVIASEVVTTRDARAADQARVSSR
jgi:O-antigen/teichoic acid export membrane protein